MTSYVEEHPGGSFELMNVAGTGRDAGDKFDEQDHSGMAKRKMK